jgi:predicted dehydrogenase
VPDNREIPDTLEVLWRYPGDTLVTFSQFNANAAAASARPCEIELRGTQGTLYLFGSGYEVVPEVVTDHEFPARTPVDRRQERGWRAGEKTRIAPKSGKGDADTARHARNFLDCVKSRQACLCDIETGHRATLTTLLGNISLKTSSWLEWDGTRERIAKPLDANRFLDYRYRSPYRFPRPPGGREAAPG